LEKKERRFPTLDLVDAMLFALSHKTIPLIEEGELERVQVASLSALGGKREQNTSMIHKLELHHSLAVPQTPMVISFTQKHSLCARHNEFATPAVGTHDLARNIRVCLDWLPNLFLRGKKKRKERKRNQVRKKKRRRRRRRETREGLLLGVRCRGSRWPGEPFPFAAESPLWQTCRSPPPHQTS